MTIKKHLMMSSMLLAAVQLAGCNGSSSDDKSDPDAPRLVSSVVDGAEIITDSETELKWVNDIQYCFAGVTTPEASNCESLNDMEVAGITDWRLPDSAEMSELILEADADPDITLNYINPSCAVMTASDGWVFTENSEAPGTFSQVEPGNAGVRCVSGEPAMPEQRLRTIFTTGGSTELLRDIETELTWVNDIQFCFAGIIEKDATNCDTLNVMNVGGLADWRTPNGEEMSELIQAVVADEDVTLNYINPACAVMTTSDAWVFTENSEAPGMLSQVQPGNAGLRCVSPTVPPES